MSSHSKIPAFHEESIIWKWTSIGLVEVNLTASKLQSDGGFTHKLILPFKTSSISLRASMICWKLLADPTFDFPSTVILPCWKGTGNYTKNFLPDVICSLLCSSERFNNTICNTNNARDPALKDASDVIASRYKQPLADCMESALFYFHAILHHRLFCTSASAAGTGSSPIAALIGWRIIRWKNVSNRYFWMTFSVSVVAKLHKGVLNKYCKIVQSRMLQPFFQTHC